MCQRTLLFLVISFCVNSCGPREEPPSIPEVPETGVVTLAGFPFTVDHSVGQADRARDMAVLCQRTMEHLQELFGFRPTLHLKVLAPQDWSAHTTFPVYGMPHPTSDSTIVMAAEDNGFWRGFTPPLDQLPADVAARFRSVYSTSEGTTSMRSFFDLLVLHELGHLYEYQSDLSMPRKWMSELFCNVLLHTFIAEREPALLDALTLLPQLGAQRSKAELKFTTLAELEEHYDTVAREYPDNYGWYQFKLHQGAADIHDAAGDAALRHLWVTFGDPQPAMDDTALTSLLRTSVHPSVAHLVEQW